MEGNPGADSWTTVGKKATKKKTRDGSQHGEAGRGQPSSQPSDRKKKESTGSRPDRGVAGGERRPQGDRDRRGQQQQGDRGGGRRPPSGRGGSAQRNTLPRRPQDGRGGGGGGQRGGAVGATNANSASDRKQNSVPGNQWETWAPAQTAAVTSSATSSPRKQSWASLVDRSTPAPRETSTTPPPTTTASMPPAQSSWASVTAPTSGVASNSDESTDPTANAVNEPEIPSCKAVNEGSTNATSHTPKDSPSPVSSGNKTSEVDSSILKSDSVKPASDETTVKESSTNKEAASSIAKDEGTATQASDEPISKPNKSSKEMAIENASSPELASEEVDNKEDAEDLDNSNKTESDNNISAERECDNTNANYNVSNNIDHKPVVNDSSNQTAEDTNTVPSIKPIADIQDETQSSSQHVDSKLDNKSYESLDNDQNGLHMKIDKNIKENVDANGNNVSLDSNKNKLVKGVSPSMEDVLSRIDPDTRQYDRDILLMLQKHPLSLQKPEKLPELEIVLNAPMRSSASAPLLGDKPASNFVRPGLPTKRDSKRREPKKVISISRGPVVLRQSDNAWKAKKDNKEHDLLANKVRAILNKLTPTNFQTLVVQFKELEINTEEQISLAMELVFEKAVEEPAYSKNYASLCKELSMKRVIKEGTDQVLDFRSLLMQRCRVEFEKDYISAEDRKKYEDGMKNAETEDEKKKIKDEFEQKESKMRKRSLGNIRFVGELYIQDLLRQYIVHNHIIMKLLNSVDEESLECLCKFLTTCGAKLEEEAVHVPVEYREKVSLTKYFSKIQSIIDERKTSSRVRFMLQDLVELKTNRWVNLRRKETGPKTISEVHKEAKVEELKIQLADSQLDPPVARRSEEKARRKTEYRPKPVVSDEGWNNVPTKAAKISLDMDPEKLRIRKVDADTMRLGGGFTSWGMGSSAAKSGGAGSGGQSGRTTMNRYQLLEDSDQSAPAATSTSHLYAGRASEPVIRSVDRSSSRASASLEQARGSASGEDRDSPARDVSASSADSSRNFLRGSDEVDTEALRSKFKLLLQEYLSNCDFKETLNSVCEMFSQSNIGILVEETINLGLERTKPLDRSACGRLLVGLVKQGVLTADIIVSGTAIILEIAEDLLIDIPKFWEFLADILVIVILDIACFNTLIESCCGYLPNSAFKKKFVSSILLAVQSRDGEKLTTYLTDSRKVLEDVLSQDLEAFLEESKLSQKKAESETVVAETKLVNGNLQESLHRQLTKLFEKRDTGNQEMSAVDTILCDKVLDNETIRTLVYAVMESVVTGARGEACTLQKDLLLERLQILKKYIDANKDRELYAMFALQNLVHRLEHPHKLLHEILEIMYDNEVISDEGIFDWEKNEYVEEQEGKGVAVAGCKQFLEWLHSAEEEDDSNENQDVSPEKLKGCE